MDAASAVLLLVSGAAVILMVFGLALFYAGQTSERSVINTLLMSFGAFAVVLPLWVLLGFDIAYDGTNDLFLLFQGAFAIIATALISGSVAGRMKFSSWLIFAGIWSLAVYSVLAEMTWNPNGWLYQLGSIDLAGGGPIHIASGVSGLVLALLLGQRFTKHIRHNVPLVMVGSGILIFGWTFFNSASALTTDPVILGTIAVNTMLAAAVGALAWFAIDSVRHRKATALSGASGSVAALVAITPAAASLTNWEAAILGAVAALAVHGVLILKDRLPVDDALDVAAFHSVAGIIGSLSIGVALGWEQLGYQAVAVTTTVIYAALVTAGIGLVLKYSIGLRIQNEIETEGIDSSHELASNVLS